MQHRHLQRAAVRMRVLAGSALLVSLAGVLTPLPAAAATTSAAVLSSYAGVPGDPGSDAHGQSARHTHLRQPAGLVSDAAGDLYVADPASHVVNEVVDGLTYVVAGEAGIAGTPGQVAAGVAIATPLVSPTGLALLPDGSLLIADPGAHVVWRVDRGAMSVFAGTGRSGPAADGLAAGEPLEAPTGLAVDPAGTVYVSDPADDTLWSVAGGRISHLAGRSGAAGFADGRDPTVVRFAAPTGLAWSAGHLLVADGGNHRVRAVNVDGAAGTLAGPMGLVTPTGLLAEAAGTILVADPAAGRVLQVAGGTTTVVAGRGGAGVTVGTATSPDGTPASTASLARPTALAQVSPGRFLIAERGGAVVRSVGPPLAVPARPAAPVVALADGRATVTWTTPDDGGSPITSWTLREYAGSAAPVAITVIGARSIDVQGLLDGVSYAFTMTAVNGLGPSVESPAGGSLGPDTVPGSPLPPTSAAPVVTPTTAPTTASGTELAPNRSRPGSSASATPLVSSSVTSLPRLGRIGQHQAMPTVVTPGTDQPAPPPAHPPAPLPGQLIPVHSLADAASDVATVTSRTAIPLVLAGLLVAFLLLQGFVDRRDPKLALAPVDIDRGLDFEPLA